MQHDPDFAARLRRGEDEAVASTGLGAAELACLRAADPRAVAADRDGKRAAQLLRNVCSEFRLATRVGPDGGGGRDWIAAFPRSSHFHTAVAEDRSLPLAFAEHARDVATGASSAAFRALVSLEAELARARRQVPAAPAAAPGEVVLAGVARLVTLPAGTWALAAALDAGEATAKAPRLGDDGQERVLLVADAEPPAPGALRAVRAEPLPDAVAAFLVRAREPLDAAARAAFARAHGVEPADVEAVVAEYVAEGVLVAGG